jgi:hypothetical protein
MSTKSPFKVYQNFISPKLCDQILAMVALKEPDRDSDGYPVKNERYDTAAEIPLVDKLVNIVPDLEQHYDLKYKGVEHLLFQHFPEGMNGLAEQPHCENSQFIRKKWVKIKDRDLTGILWLKNYHDKTPLDRRIEVYGGKLEFPIYNFSFQPQRGTLVVYPSGPHFISATSPILVGDWYGVRFHIAAEAKDGGVWFYQPENFEGDFQQWFSDHV